MEETGGSWSLTSVVGRGTRLCFRLDQAHVDVPPVGNVSSSIVGWMAFEGDYELTVERRYGHAGYCLSRRELAAALGELETASSIAMLKDYTVSQEEALEMQKGNENGSVDTGGSSPASRG